MFKSIVAIATIFLTTQSFGADFFEQADEAIKPVKGKNQKKALLIQVNKNTEATQVFDASSVVKELENIEVEYEGEVAAKTEIAAASTLLDQYRDKIAVSSNRLSDVKTASLQLAQTQNTLDLGDQVESNPAWFFSYWGRITWWSYTSWTTWTYVRIVPVYRVVYRWYWWW